MCLFIRLNGIHSGVGLNGVWGVVMEKGLCDSNCQNCEYARMVARKYHKFSTPENCDLHRDGLCPKLDREVFEIEDLSGGLISRKAVYDNIGEVELFAYLTDKDIREYGLSVDEDGEFYFTEEQGRIANVMYLLVRRYIKGFPPSEIERAQGFWKKEIEDGMYWYVCSECGSEVPKTRYKSDLFSAFCPHCGAVMNSSEE